MTKGKIWRLAAAMYVFINLAGLVYAVGEGQEMHAMSHVFLLLVGVAGWVGWRLARRGMPQAPVHDQVAEERIQYLQQSVDAMALELERVGEAQRFSDKLRVQRAETLPPKKEQQ